MLHEDFVRLVEQAFDDLPEKFSSALENIGISVEDYPTREIVEKMNLQSKNDLLGLYQGIPLTLRGSWYGMSPVSPDNIILYQKNIEAVCRSHQELESKIKEVLIHEIGHYFGMSEEEIRLAGY